MLCLGTVRAAHASELIVEWIAPPECPDQSDVLSQVERSLGAAHVNLTASARVTQQAGRYRARVQIASAAGLGERTLDNERCELLAESVALVIALSAPHAEGARRDGSGLTLVLSAHAAAVVGPLPRAALGVGGSVGVEGIAALRLELSGTYYAPQTSRFEEMNDGAHFEQLAFGVRGCRLWRLGVLELAPCVGAHLYRIAGEGFGGMASDDGVQLMWGPALGALGRLRLLSRLSVVLAADAVVPVTRRRFVFSDVREPLHRPSAIVFQLFVGPEVRF